MVATMDTMAKDPLGLTIIGTTIRDLLVDPITTVVILVSWEVVAPLCTSSNTHNNSSRSSSSSKKWEVVVLPCPEGLPTTLLALEAQVVE